MNTVQFPTQAQAMPPVAANPVAIFENSEFGQMRVVQKDGEPWFVAADVCRALGLGNVGQAVAGLDDDEKSSIDANIINSDVDGSDTKSAPLSVRRCRVDGVGATPFRRPGSRNQGREYNAAGGGVMESRKSEDGYCAQYMGYCPTLKAYFGLKAENAALRQQLAEAQARMKWQPIETAPKDGRSIIIWDADHLFHFCFARYSEQQWWPSNPLGLPVPHYLRVTSPTHWMPLPEPQEADHA